MQKIPLEDNFNDVLGKAQRGLGLSLEELARRTGVAQNEVERVLGGAFDETTVRKLAPVLGLGAEALAESGKKSWYPVDPGSVPGLACFNSVYSDMTVNAYLIWDLKTNNAACFDTGTNAGAILEFAAEREIRIQVLLLTHTHPDHIEALAELTRETNAKAFVSKQEAIPGAETFEAGHDFKIGSLTIWTRLTSGHSRGGITYVVQGLPRPIAVVGDAIFAGSMGGGMVSYRDALQNNCAHILTLPDDTILCPGHGPLTTVGEEKQHNPFFPQFRKG